MSSSEGSWSALVLAVASQAAVSICSWGLAAISPDLAAQYRLSALGLGFVAAAATLGTALVLVPAGGWVDRIGPRRSLIGGGVATGVCLLAAAAAPSVLVLVAAFAAYGACSALVTVAGSVSVFSSVAPARRGLAMGLRQMGVSLGGLLAALLLPPLVPLGGVGLALAVAAGLVTVTTVWFGMVSSGAPRQSGQPRAGLAALVARPQMWRLVSLGTVYAIALTPVLVFAVPALRDQGASAAAGSALFVVISLSAMAARVFWGRMADLASPGVDATAQPNPQRLNPFRQRWVVLRMIGAVIAVGGVAYWMVAPLGLAAHLVVMAVLAFGALGANGVLHLLGGELAGPGRTGSGIGLSQTVLFGVSGLAAPLIGALADLAGFRSLWLLVAALGLVVCALAAPAARA